MALFNLGFRVFFLGAGVYAVLAGLLWLSMFLLGWQGLPSSYSPVLWHAHEMLFGYTMAVVVGFLLTASKNWTGIQTLNGTPLGLLFLLWTLARILPFTGDNAFLWAMVCDFLFGLGATLALAYPIFRARLWRNTGIVFVLFLLTCSNLFFYLGLVYSSDILLQKGLYAGLWLFLTLVLLMARRVIPMFIQNGVGHGFRAENNIWLDRACLWVFVLFWVTDLLSVNPYIRSSLSACLFILHLVRLVGWHNSRIWKTPLLWVLYLAYGFILLGFLLYSLSIHLGISPFLSTHAFTLGGIGLLSIGMMARVAWGHTGRDFSKVPASLFWIFLLITLSAGIRTLAPLLSMELYTLWISLSFGCWIIGFSLFIAIYFPILTQPRIDNNPG